MPQHATNCRNFDDFFKSATGECPFPFQWRFAVAPLPQFVDVPTGLGKTAMAVVGWLWRRFGGDEKCRAATPRRLVYCLPMRVLVEQTAENARKWIGNLKDAGCLDSDGPPVHVLMGGEDQEDWDIYPEREAILVGTQDMLLSRALNRGYAASRSRWPIQFGLLNTDCLWVFDEVQLMGAGLATTAQLEAFRHLMGSKDGHGCKSVWMSATMQPDWLGTVDFKERIDDQGRIDGEPPLTLTNEDHKSKEVEARWNAKKPLAKAASATGNPAGLAREVLEAHTPGARTILVVNTVKRACALYDALRETAGRGPGAGAKKTGRGKGAPVSVLDAAEATQAPKVILLHSRFRPPDRARRVDEALANPHPTGMIVVSTQVIEAGVDVSAVTLFTELAPWASLVQRFGRCNRRGRQNEQALVRWIDVPDEDAAPYETADLQKARRELTKLNDVGIKALPPVKLHFAHGHVIRRKDLLDLFDTTSDLAGNDIDIDRFVREIENSDVRVFWRAWEQPHGDERPPQDEPAPRPDEVSPAPMGEFTGFVKDPKRKGKVWRWDFLDEKWEPADANRIAPGQVFLVHVDAGGYSVERGWDLDSRQRVDPIPNTDGGAPDGTADDRLSRIGVWQTVAKHSEQVCAELNHILKALPVKDCEVEALRHAARWHDRGKAHEVFRAALPDGAPDAEMVWAKAAGKWKKYSRLHFRHELASALAVLISPDGLIPPEHRALIAYLVAAHHGKVRLSIRSLPNESRPDAGRRFARGIWDGDTLPATDLGGGVSAPAVALSLEPMELGLCEQPPFVGQPSWAERMIGLRDRLGPFRLAYLEAILRAADMRASRAAEQQEAEQAIGGKEVAGG